MSGGDLLQVHPTELKFPFELMKQSSCSMQLSNKTDQYVAFKVKTTNPNKYCVRPNSGIVTPGSTFEVKVTMQAPREAPLDLHCKDKFLLQAVVASFGATTKDITPEMFNKEPEKVFQEFKFRVIYVPANRPSPVPEEPEETSSPRSSTADNGSHNLTLFDADSRYTEERSKDRPNEELSIIKKLTEEKNSVAVLNQKLQQELELLKRENNRRKGDGFSMRVGVLVGLLGLIIGYFLKKK